MLDESKYHSGHKFRLILYAYNIHTAHTERNIDITISTQDTRYGMI